MSYWQNLTILNALKTISVAKLRDYRVILSAVFVLITFFIIVFWLSSKPPYLVINASTEMVEYKVTRPEVAKVPVVRARAGLVGSRCTDLLEGGDGAGRATGLIEPASGALVRYRWAPSRVSVQLLGNAEAPVGTFRRSDGRSCPLMAQARFVFSHPASASPAARPLPIVGPAEVGYEFGTPNAPSTESRRVFGMMRHGRVEVFGRVVLFGQKDALYPIESMSFPLPAGGRLVTGDGLRENESAAQAAPWYGFAIIGTGGFDVSATTETNDLRLHRPGFTQESERFAVGLVSKLVNDPSFSFVTLVIALIAGVLQMAAVFFTGPASRDDSTKAPDNGDRM